MGEALIVRRGSNGDGYEIGDIQYTSYIIDDDNWVLCDGSNLVIDDYPELEGIVPKAILWNSKYIGSESMGCTNTVNGKSIYTTGDGTIGMYDGTAWYEGSGVSSSYDISCIKYCSVNNKYIASGYRRIYYSTDAITWSYTSISTGTYNSLFYVFSKWYAIASASYIYIHLLIV